MSVLLNKNHDITSLYYFVLFHKERKLGQSSFFIPSNVTHICVGLNGNAFVDLTIHTKKIHQGKVDVFFQAVTTNLNTISRYIKRGAYHTCCNGGGESSVVNVFKAIWGIYMHDLLEIN